MVEGERLVMYEVEVPAGVTPGSSFQCNVGGQLMSICVPEGVEPGQNIQVAAPSAVPLVAGIPVHHGQAGPEAGAAYGTGTGMAVEAGYVEVDEISPAGWLCLIIGCFACPGLNLLGERARTWNQPVTAAHRDARPARSTPPREKRPRPPATSHEHRPPLALTPAAKTHPTTAVSFVRRSVHARETARAGAPVVRGRLLSRACCAANFKNRLVEALYNTVTLITRVFKIFAVPAAVTRASR